MNSTNTVIVVGLFILVTFHAAQAIKCYSCQSCRSNALALRNWTECAAGEACLHQHALSGTGHLRSAHKGCVATCTNPGVVTNAGMRGRRYCCYDDFCNQESTYRPDLVTPWSSSTVSTVTQEMTSSDWTVSTTSPPFVPGPEGSVGPRGPEGSVGPRGPQGQRGARGLPGRAGPRGRTGAAGTQGIRGAEGPTGTLGNPGAQGLPGDQGERGEQGLPGTDGATGSMGPPGICGCDDMTSSATSTNNDVTTPISPVSPAPTVAFHGYVSNKRQTLTILETIGFDEIVTNIGGLLDETSVGNNALFTIPVSGVYMFQATSRANGIGATPLVLYYNDSVVLATGRSSANAIGSYPLGTNHVILHLKKGEELDLYIKAIDSSVAVSIFINTFSSPSDITFSAYLISALS